MIQTFPNDQSAIRIVGALLAKTNDDWQERAYFDMDEDHESKATVTLPIVAAETRKAA